MADRSVKEEQLRTILSVSADSKLTKSIYTSIDISSAVELIMYREVPMEMRTSGLLLFGIVRIYRKKVESLFRDSNIVLIDIKRAVTSMDTNWPSRATFGSVLPDKFELDSFDMDTEFTERSQDNHLKDRREITLEGATLGAKQCDPSNHQRVALLSYDRSPGYQGTEIMCEASFQSSSGNVWPDQREDRLEPDWVLMKMLEQTEAHDLGVDLVPAVSPLPTEEGLEFFDSDDSAHGCASPTLQIRSTPPPQQTPPKQRRIRQFDIHATILSDECMKKWIADPSSILRPRKNFPPDALCRWRQNKRIKGDAIFFEPLLTGSGSELCEAYRKDFISGKPYLCSPVNGDNMEIGHDMSAGNKSLAENLRSPTKGHDRTPALGGDTSSLFDDLVELTSCHGSLDLEDHATTPGSDEVTPMVSLMGTPGVEVCGPYNPELRTSCDGELTFLEEQDNNSSGPQETSTPGRFVSGTSEFEPLSARTRAVARFLKDRSSVTPVVEREQSVNVSLETILEGKRRKVCARVVFETLVLKNCGLVDVQQEKPYSDVVLTLMPKLSNELFSA